MPRADRQILDLERMLSDVRKRAAEYRTERDIAQRELAELVALKFELIGKLDDCQTSLRFWRRPWTS